MTVTRRTLLKAREGYGRMRAPWMAGDLLAPIPESPERTITLDFSVTY